MKRGRASGLTFKLLVGLPGSGKTMWAQQQPYQFFYDFTQNGGLPMLECLIRSETVIISDFGFIFKKTRDRAVEILDEMFPGCTIEWIVWENDPKQCALNLDSRRDGRNITAEVLRDAARYTYPENYSELFPVFRPS